MKEFSELKKGDTVVIDYTDKRVCDKPTLTTIATCGKKYITVDKICNNIVFFREKEYNGMLTGGNKDGSYCVFRLAPCQSLEEYEEWKKVKAEESAMRKELEYLILKCRGEKLKEIYRIAKG